MAVETRARVLNQSVPFEDVDLLAGDAALREGLEREGAGWATDRVREAGVVAASAEAQAHWRRAERNEPRLVTHDRFGHRVDQVELDPSWHWLLDGAVQRGDPRAAVGRPAAGRARRPRGARVPLDARQRGRHVPGLDDLLRGARAARGPGDRRRMGAAPDRRRAVRDGDDREAGRLGRARQHHAGAIRSATAGTSCTATSGSAPIRPATIFLVLAQAPAGLSCFVVERGAGMEFQRLKDKLGTRSLPSSEVEFRGAAARLLGEEGRGVATIIEMVTHTRLDCIVGSAASMRRGVAEAVWHARHRSAFGARLVDQPAMINVLADLALESEAATATALRLARAYDEGDTAFRRFGTAIAKYWVCKRATPHAAEALECLGGNGYVEESPMPRLLRDAPLNGIWEGSGNVIALDVLRALSREPEGLAAFSSRVRAGARWRTRCWTLTSTRCRARSTPGPPAARSRSWRSRSRPRCWCASRREFVADAFCAARLGGGGRVYGTLPYGVDGAAIVARALEVD